jgi:hypothetical protein
MVKFIKMASLLILLCVIMTSTLLINVKATVSGVSQGNVFEYNMIAHWNSPTEATPAEILEVNQTKTITITVTEVSSSNVSTKITTSYLNGTKATADGFCNIDTGECVGLPFIGANLNKNDLVDPSAPEPWSVNETVTRTYQNDTRETNYLKIEDNGSYEDVGEVTRTYEYYFDRSTGVLVEYTMEVSYGDTTSSTESKLLSSNVWTVDGAVQLEDSNPSSPNTLYIAATAVIIVIIAAAALVVWKRRNRSK